jgi:hypothetical protein
MCTGEPLAALSTVSSLKPSICCWHLSGHFDRHSLTQVPRCSCELICAACSRQHALVAAGEAGSLRHQRVLKPQKSAAGVVLRRPGPRSLCRSEAAQGGRRRLGELAALLDRQASHAAASCSRGAPQPPWPACLAYRGRTSAAAAAPLSAPAAAGQLAARAARLPAGCRTAPWAARPPCRGGASAAAAAPAFALAPAGRLLARAALPPGGVTFAASGARLRHSWLRPGQQAACAFGGAAVSVAAARGRPLARSGAACLGAAAATAARGACRGFCSYGYAAPELPQWVRARMASIPALPEGANHAPVSAVSVVYQGFRAACALAVGGAGLITRVAASKWWLRPVSCCVRS